jgi:uncharacterized protein
MKMAWNKPVPYAEATLKPFWDGLKEHRFCLMKCTECGEWYFPASYCRNHKNKPFFGSLEWTEASGRGKVITFNLTTTALRPEFKDDVPYVYALIQTEEGPVIASNVIGCPPETVHIDMPVQVVYRDIPEIDITLPYFEPASKQ